MSVIAALKRFHSNVLLYIRSTKIRYILPGVWLSLSLFTVIATLSLLSYNIDLHQDILKSKDFPKYSVYSSKPLVLGATTQNLSQGDARAVSINKTFEKYNCPLIGSGETFVKYADQYNIPYWVVASIAFQESSCGKNVFIHEGETTHNYYGWGIWGDNVSSFESLDHGIEVMSKYLSDTFYSNGVTDLCEIMKTYTPPSNGSWCRGVGFFRDEIIGFESY